MNIPRLSPRSYVLPQDLKFSDQLISGATSEILDYTSNEIHLSAELTNPGWLVIADTYYPGWKAEINGEPGEVFQVLGTFRGLLFEPGQYKIRMYFDPPSLKIGIWISGTSLFCLIALHIWVLSWKRRKNRES